MVSLLKRLCYVAALVSLLSLLLILPATAQTQDPADIDAPPELKASLVEIDSLRRAGAYDEALSAIASLDSKYENNADLLHRLALTRVDVGENETSERRQSSMYSKALDAAQAAVEADSMNAYAHLSLAIAEGRVALTAGTREKIQRSRAVKAHADRATELDPDLSSAYHVRARWNREVADLGFFSRAVVRTVYGGLPEASFEQSVKDFKTAIEKEDTIVHHIELARTYLKMDREQDAKKQLELLLTMENDNPDDPRHKQEAKEMLNDLS